MLGLKGTSGKPEVFLGAFGKHPGWDDHMDDRGLETQRLVDFRTLVYVEGVAAAVECGKWDQLEAGARLDGFDHVIVLRTRGDVVVARMWASSDGKGRTKYPMVVVAQISGIGMEATLRKVLPELEVVKARCEEAKTAAEVNGILDSARALLRGWAEGIASDDERARVDVTIPAGFVGGLADRAEYGPARRGFHRVIYHLERDVPGMVREPDGGAGRMNEAPRDGAAPVAAMRLPGGVVEGGGGTTVEARVLDCLRLLLARLEAWSPMMVVAPVRAGHVDVVVGEPRGADVLGLLVGTGAMPLTTEIPYTVEPAMAARVDAWVEKQKGGRTVEVTSESAAKKLGVKAGRFLTALCVGAAVMGACGARDAGAQTPSSATAEPKQQYNSLLADFQLAVIDPATTDDRAAAAAKDFLAKARAVPGGIAFLGDVRKTLAAVEGAVDNKHGGGGSDAIGMGPGATGVYAGKADGSLVRFSAAAAEGLPELAFARVNMPDGTVTYIQTTEVSVGQMGAILQARSTSAELAKLSFPWFERGNDPRRGPRSWEWGSLVGGRPGVIPARAWQSRMGLGAVAEYPTGAEPAAPDADSPMQYVPPAVAVYAARLVGCRLPTVAEWTAARAQLAGDVKDTEWNLRDKAWMRQYEHAKSQLAEGKRVQLPNAGSFAPEKGSTPHAREGEDGTVWFTGVDKSGGKLVHNLVGNVAEYVFETPAGVMPEARTTGAEEFVTSHRNYLRVIGGSALSDPAVGEKAIAIVVDEAVEGYSDVGFRLAFSGGTDARSSLAARLRKILDPLPTLP